MGYSARNGLGAERKSERDRVRNPHARRGQAGQARQMLEHLLEGQVLAAQNIFLADSAAFGGEQMAARAVFDVDEIQPGVHVRRHPAVQGNRG